MQIRLKKFSYNEKTEQTSQHETYLDVRGHYLILDAPLVFKTVCDLT